MKRLLFPFLLCLLFSFSARSQYSMDFGASMGMANYLGEIGGGEGDARPFLLDMKFNQTQFAFGGFYRVNFTREIAAKVSFTYARIEGADSLSGNPNRVARNLSFRTDLLEFALEGQYAFFSFNDISRRSKNRVDFNTYALIGAGYLLYYPHAQFNDRWYSLRPLATEGIENQYDEAAFVYFGGLGASFTFNRKIRLGFEAAYRFANTDYLDDVSTDYAYDPRFPFDDAELPFEESKLFANRSDEAYERGDADLPNRDFHRRGGRRGNPDGNDGYLFAQVTLSYVIARGNSFSRSRYRSVVNRRKKRTKF